MSRLTLSVKTRIDRAWASSGLSSELQIGKGKKLFFLCELLLYFEFLRITSQCGKVNAGWTCHWVMAMVMAFLEHYSAYSHQVICLHCPWGKILSMSTVWFNRCWCGMLDLWLSSTNQAPQAAAKLQASTRLTYITIYCNNQSCGAWPVLRRSKTFQTQVSYTSNYQEVMTKMVETDGHLPHF